MISTIRRRSRSRIDRRLRAALALVFLSVPACGAEETIDVTRLPPGTARGSVATGFYPNWTENVTSSNCPESIEVGGTNVHLPLAGDSWEADADVLQDEGYFAIYMSRFAAAGPSEVVRPDYLADGGLYVGGEFRIGGVFTFASIAEGTFVQARVLIDGRYSVPPVECAGVVRSFQGPALVQVEAREAGKVIRTCEYRLAITGDRPYVCGDV